MNAHIVVMGVCGCGKSTIGQQLGEVLDLDFVDGDAYHPPANIQKMEQGTPLTDDDRWPWLERIGEALGRESGLIIACSALKRDYRSLISKTAGRTVVFVHLTGSRQLLASRMKHRTGHFMPTSLLDSQLEILEPLSNDECGFAVDIDQSVTDIVTEAAQHLATIPSVHR